MIVYLKRGRLKNVGAKSTDKMDNVIPCYELTRKNMNKDNLSSKNNKNIQINILLKDNICVKE